ncbi:MAG: outer membrane protein transport protein [Deltaproteobacteria bacterium]|nr:outer membrane protein transport protein [Deltaproteobacteria bacterium]
MEILVRRRALALLAFVACAGFASSARAAPIGSLFSGATADDPAATYYNPAAMTQIAGTQGLLWSGLAFVRGHYQRDTRDAYSGQSFPQADLNVLKPGPNGGVVTSAGLRRWRFGLGFSVPILDGAQWPAETEGRPSSTRYHALSARLLELAIQPSVAFRVTRFLSLGLGVDVVGVQLAHEVQTDFGAKINQLACEGVGAGRPCAVDTPLARENPAYAALTTVKGFGWSAGVGAGVLVTPRRWLRLGLGVRSGGFRVRIPVNMRVELPGAVTQYVRNNLPSVKLPELEAEGEVEVTSPMRVTAGIALFPIRPLELAVDFQWIDKSAMSILVGNIHRSSSSLISDQVLIKTSLDVFHLALRAAYRVHRTLRLALRVEWEPNTRPERFTSPGSVDFDRVALLAGLAYSPFRWLTVLAEYGRYFAFSRTVGASNYAPNASPTTPEEEGLDKTSPTGRYSAEIDRVGLGVLLSF